MQGIITGRLATPPHYDGTGSGGIRVEVALRNNSAKPISAFRGTLRIFNSLDECLSEVEILVDKTIQAGDEVL